MIAYLNGVIQKKTGDSIIVDINGIGYLVHVNNNLLSECEENDTIELYIHTSVREDAISLYGMASYKELEMFKLLISVSGVGPKTGLEMLNTPISSLKYAITNGDTALLTSVPGIGKKTAERIIVDLKNKVEPTNKPDEYANVQELDNDAIVALEKLGYRRHQIIHTLKNIPEDIKKTEDIIRYFLQNA